jgi:hypothetical protein
MTTGHSLDPRRSERGIALVLSLFLMMAMSIVAASLMFMSQTETYSSMNYRLMSQARYGAEAGISKAANYLMFSYAAPQTGGGDPLAAYVYSGVSPVTWGGNPVVLSANPAVPSNYPVAAVQAAFSAAAGGTLSMAGTNVNYQPYATLMSMRQVNVYGGGVATIQTWQVVSDGVVSLGRTAKVEVTATIESVPTPAGMYAAFATDGGCGALTFSGNMAVDSYDSSTYNAGLGGQPTAANGQLTASGGNVGTNGNLGFSGSAVIDGTLSTPRIGIGACSQGNVDALTASGAATLCPNPNATCTNGTIQPNSTVQLPQAWQVPTPPAPSPMPPTSTVSIDHNTACSDLGLASTVQPAGTAYCTFVNGHGNVNDVLTVVPNGATIAWGNVTVGSKIDLVLQGGQYNVNSIAFTANSSSTIGTVAGTGPVVMNVAGVGIDPSSGYVVDFGGGALMNSTFDPSLFQIEYAGTGQLQMRGNSTASAMVMAPNAAATLVGTADFYGAMVAKTFNVTGNVNMHYDRHLASNFYFAGSPMLSSFSWKRF